MCAVTVNNLELCVKHSKTCLTKREKSLLTTLNLLTTYHKLFTVKFNMQTGCHASQIAVCLVKTFLFVPYAVCLLELSVMGTTARNVGDSGWRGVWSLSAASIIHALEWVELLQCYPWYIHWSTVVSAASVAAAYLCASVLPCLLQQISYHSLAFLTFVLISWIISVNVSSFLCEGVFGSDSYQMFCRCWWGSPIKVKQRLNWQTD